MISRLLKRDLLLERSIGHRRWSFQMQIAGLACPGSHRDKLPPRSQEEMQLVLTGTILLLGFQPGGTMSVVARLSGALFLPSWLWSRVAGCGPRRVYSLDILMVGED